MKRILIFTHEKSTKNTERYTEAGERDKQIVGTLYVQRSAFNGSVPQQLTVTIES